MYLFVIDFFVKGNNIMYEKNKISIFEVNILYLLLGILFFYFGGRAQSREVYSGLLITEYVIILLPNLIYLKSRNLSLKKVLRLNKISFKQVGYIILITIFSYPIAIFVNTLMLTILSFFGETIPSTVPIPDNLPMYFFGLFVIALAPGICEEVMFRGTMMNSYRNLGRNKAIIYSAILFGIFHLNLQNLLGPIFLGLILGITAYKTNSIYSSILGHTLSNGIALTIGYFTMKAQSKIGDVPAYEIPHQVQMLIVLAVVSVFALVSLFILIKLIKKLPGAEIVEVQDAEFNHSKVIHYLPLIPIIVLYIMINTKYLFI